jgi:hypothetical protein
MTDNLFAAIKRSPSMTEEEFADQASKVASLLGTILGFLAAQKEAGASEEVILDATLSAWLNCVCMFGQQEFTIGMLPYIKAKLAAGMQTPDAACVVDGGTVH